MVPLGVEPRQLASATDRIDDFTGAIEAGTYTYQAFYF